MLSRVVTVIAAAALVLAGSGAPSVGAPAGERAGAAITVVGSGYGHGRGLSQWGAYHQADQGRSTQQILSFYYPGLRRSSLGGSVRVLLTADTSADVVVQARSGLVVRSLGNGRTYPLRKSARLWRITPAADGRRSAVAWKAPGQGRWRTLRTLPGEAQFQAGGAAITLRTPSGRRAYTGAVRSARPTATSRTRDTVNVVSLETYVRGVVPNEVPALWPAAAVRAQAIAARTYAAFERAASPRGRHWQICDTTSCQVYGGASSEHPAANAAVRATARQVLTTGGRPAFTQFSASNGGHTLGGTVSYLPAKADPYDVAHRDWRATISAAAIERALPGHGAFRSARVVRADGKGRYAGRVELIRLTFAERSVDLSGDDFRSWFGLRSTLFELR